MAMISANSINPKSALFFLMSAAVELPPVDNLGTLTLHF